MLIIGFNLMLKWRQNPFPPKHLCYGGRINMHVYAHYHLALPCIKENLLNNTTAVCQYVKVGKKFPNGLDKGDVYGFHISTN